MAPEILNDKFYNQRVDVWSFGVAVFESIFESMPFNGTDKPELIKNVNKGFVNLPKPTFPSKSCLDFLSKCLRHDP